jgi:antitoxin MazE7
MASTAMIRVSVETRDRLAEIAERKHTTIGELVEQASQRLYREEFWKEVRESYARLQADPEAWAEYKDEMRIWEATLMDGLEEYPYDYGDEDE